MPLHWLCQEGGEGHGVHWEFQWYSFTDCSSPIFFPFPLAIYILQITIRIFLCDITGVETSVGDVNSGIVTVVGKVNPTEICRWLKRKTKKSVKIVYPDAPIEDHKQVLAVR